MDGGTLDMTNPWAERGFWSPRANGFPGPCSPTTRLRKRARFIQKRQKRRWGKDQRRYVRRVGIAATRCRHNGMFAKGYRM